MHNIYNYILKQTMFLGYIVLQLFYSYIIIIIIISGSSSCCCYNHLLCIVFTIIFLKQTMFLGYIVLQLFYSYIIISSSSCCCCCCCYNHLLCIVFTIIFLKQTMFLGYIVLQLFYSYIIIIIITVAFQISRISRAKTAELKIFDSVPYFSKQGNVCKLQVCAADEQGYSL